MNTKTLEQCVVRSKDYLKACICILSVPPNQQLDGISSARSSGRSLETKVYHDREGGNIRQDSLLFRSVFLLLLEEKSKCSSINYCRPRVLIHTLSHIIKHKQKTYTYQISSTQPFYRDHTMYRYQKKKGGGGGWLLCVQNRRQPILLVTKNNLLS